MKHEHTHPKGAHLCAFTHPNPLPCLRPNKLIKEGAAPAGNLIKYDIPALKSMLTEQKEDGTLLGEIVTAHAPDPLPY